jgi:hypothetical protein
MGREVEIIPPSRTSLSDRGERHLAQTPQEYHPSGVLSSRLATWEANRRTRVIEARAAATRSQAKLFDAQTQAVESYIKRNEALNRLAELPEILANDRIKRRMERAEELRELRHRHELAEEYRLSEVARAQSTRVAVEQELQARRDYGYLTHSIEWKRKQCEMLDVELSAAERRAILRQHIGELDEGRKAADPPADAATEQLYRVREQMLADGIDTRHLDAALERGKQTVRR